MYERYCIIYKEQIHITFKLAQVAKCRSEAKVRLERNYRLLESYFRSSRESDKIMTTGYGLTAEYFFYDISEANNDFVQY